MNPKPMRNPGSLNRSSIPRFRLFRPILAGALAIFLAASNVACGTPQTDGASGAKSGGRLVATFRSEPANFNRLVDNTLAGRLIGMLAHATLVRLNPITGDLEPRLAESWSASPDGLTWTLTLRPNVRFSDGAPFTAADVLFTFKALYDPNAGSVLAEDLSVNGEPLKVSAPDDRHVTVTFPLPYGPGLAILNGLPILPKHKLESSLADGTFRAAWTSGVSPADMAGLGPFMLAEYVPAQRMHFVRNPNFWLKDEQGQQLPYLDELDVPIVPEQNAELLRLQSGDSDLTNGGARAEDLAMLRDAAGAGRLHLVDAGASTAVSTFWFNLAPGSKALAKKPWLGDEAFRRALSHAINRQAIVDTVHLGAATVVYGPVSPGFGDWYVPDMGATPFDQSRSRALLASIGLEDRDGDGIREDASKRPVRFSVLTQRGNTERERTSEVIKEQLRQVGIAVDVVALDQGGIQGRFGSGDYETIYYGVSPASTEPVHNLPFWLSNGPFHFWNPGQATPATDWEARIDELMHGLESTMDPATRKRMFTDVQQLVADHVPALWFAAAHVTVPMSARVGGATPTVSTPVVLWNAERLYVSGERR